jgi:hypothetical protein
VNVLTYGQVYALARGVGLSHEQAVTATAIARGESGLDADAVGDVSLTDATWGPSMGLWQVRSIKAERGSGQTRDAAALPDPAFNARSMHAISGGGVNWSPWSVFTSGAYAQYVDQVRKAVGSQGVDAPGAPRNPAQDAGWNLPDPGDIAGGIGKGLGKVGGLLNPFDDIIGAIWPAVLTGLVVAGGIGLVLVGVVSSVRRPS